MSLSELQSIALRLRLDARNALAGFHAAIAADHLVEAAETLEALDVEVAELRQEVDRLRGLVRSHRGRRDFMGGTEQCDRDLWTAVLGDGPWGRDIKGDG